MVEAPGREPRGPDHHGVPCLAPVICQWGGEGAALVSRITQCEIAMSDVKELVKGSHVTDTLNPALLRHRQLTVILELC